LLLAFGVTGDCRRYKAVEGWFAVLAEPAESWSGIPVFGFQYPP